MTTLLVEPLKDKLEQKFRLKLDRRYTIASIMPYLYVHNSPNGIFKLSLVRDGFTVFSHEFTCEDLKAALNTNNNYLHVFFPVIPINPLILGPCDFMLRLEASDYNPNFSSQIGWIQQHEDLNNSLDYVPLSDAQNPLATRIKEYKKDVHMEVGFVDGFSSATAPNIIGSTQEDFELLNNVSIFSPLAGFILDKDKVKSAFALVEFERIHEVTGSEEVFRGTQEITFVFNNDSWEMLPGQLTGYEMLQESIISESYHIVLRVNVVTGQVEYKSGNMTGEDYTGKLKASITRIVSA